VPAETFYPVTHYPFHEQGSWFDQRKDRFNRVTDFSGGFPRCSLLVRTRRGVSLRASICNWHAPASKRQRLPFWELAAGARAAVLSTFRGKPSPPPCPQGARAVSVEIGLKLPEIAAYFYRTTGGTEPVLDWLRSLPAWRPASNIRFGTATPMAASVCWPTKPRARSRGPISDL
jgi:hypothetical protein